MLFKKVIEIMTRSKGQRIKKYWARKFFIRFHMSLILIGTILVGLLVSYILFKVGLKSMAIRYPISVILSYAAFFLFIRLWLAYVRKKDSVTKRILDASGDLVSFPDFSVGNASSQEVAFVPGGGEFGGGGVSGSFDIPATGTLTERSLSSPDIVGVGDTAGEGVVDAAASVLDEGVSILIPLMIVIAIVFGASIFLIYEAPLILTEAAFEFVLAGVLIKQAKVIDNPNWVGSIFKNTWKPFACTLVIACCIAFVLSNIFPEASKITDII
jgi:hypothetical protein